MARQFKEALAARPDGIAMMGHPGEAALAPLIDEAQREGILVTALNVDLPESHRRFAAQGFGYAGQDVPRSGRRLAEAALRVFQVPAGSEVLLTGVKQYPLRGERTSAAERVLLEAGMQVVYIQDNGQREDFAKLVVAHLRAHPATRLVLDDADVGFLAGALKRAGFAADTVPLAGFDLSPQTIQHMREGRIGLISDQQPYLQGYLAVLQLAMSKRYRCAGLDIDTGAGFVHPGNLEAVASLVRAGRR